MNRQLCGNRMNKRQFFRVFIPAYTQGLIPEAIRKGYKNKGIYPLNPQAEKLKNIQASAVYDRCQCILGLLGGVRVIVFIFYCVLGSLGWNCFWMTSG